VKSYPHDPEAYTQGLFWSDGALIESTGEYGRSTLRRVTLETGEVTQSVSLTDDFFAEGAVRLGDRIYQITWREGRCFVYDATSLERTGEFAYSGEGWGLATDGARIYMSDGTPNITIRNAQTFAAEGSIVVRRDGRVVAYVNEMEWIDGRIWANVYTTGEIIVIDPATGNVDGVVDLSDLASQIDVAWNTDVMNGIAHDPATGRIWVTGKNWNKLFEIEISK
jgi:glutamine cyclotransferase